MPANVDVLDVDGGGEGFQRAVVEVVDGGQQVKVFGDACLQRAAQVVVVDRQRDVVGDQREAVQLVAAIKRLPIAAPQGDGSHQLVLHAQRGHALEDVGRDVAVGGEEFVGLLPLRAKQLRSAQLAERVHLARQQGNDARLGKCEEALRGQRLEQGRLVGKREKSAFA